MIHNNKILVLVLLGLIGLTNLMNAQVDTAWTRRWTSAGANGDYIYGLAVDDEGNVYVTGSKDFIGTTPELLTIKYNSAGDTVWTRVPARTGSQLARAVAVGASGNAYITGYTMESGNGDYITVKYRPDGTEAWVRIYAHSGTGYDFARKLVLDDQENVYITGYAQASFKNVYATVKYDSSGTQLWTRQDSFGGATTSYPSDLGIDNSGNPYIVSKTKSATEGDNYVVAKYNPASGDTFWVRTYNGPANGTDEARAIAFDASNNVYVTGISAGGASTGNDIATIKYDSAGVQQWVARYNNPDTVGTDAGNWIKVDGSGNVFVYGYSLSRVGTNNYDLVLIKYNSSGDEVGRGRYDGPGGYDYPVDKDGQKGMAIDQFGNIYVLGLTRQVGSGNENDYITIKFNSSCDTQWTKRYDYADSFETPYAIEADNHYNVYVTGRSVAPVSYYDVLTIKYTQSAHTISTTAHGGGTITPSGSIVVSYGTYVTFTITPDLGYHIDSVVVDGVGQGAIPSYTFEAVTDDHTIDAYFSINTFTILATSTTGGTITPSGDVVVNYGGDTTFTIAANTDYQLDSVLVDEVSVGAVTSYPFTDVIDDHTIHAMFSMTALPGWTQKESLPPLVKDGGALVGVTGTKDGDLLFAFRGAKSKEFYMYDGTWTAKETIPFGYKYPLIEPPAINKKYPGKGAAFCYDGVNTIYATKGNGTWEFWAYDMETDTWTAKAFIPSLQKIKGGTSMAYYEGKVYLLAGAQKKDNLNNFFVYNPAADSDLGIPWTALSGAPVTPPLTLKAKPFKDGSAIAVIGNTIYAIKGGDKYNFFYAYDIATDIWTELETIPLVHSALGKKNKVGDGGAMTTDGSILYVIKGKGKQDFWSYNPISEGVWTSLDTIPRVGVAFKKSVPKTGAGLAYANSRVWLLKGNKTYEFWSFVLSKENSKVNFVGQGFSLATQSKPKGLPYMQTATIDVTPNPFTKLTTIRYTVPISGKVSLKLYNATGRLIEILQDGYLSSGIYSMNLSDIVKGIYFLKYESNTNKSEVKLIVQ